MKLSPTGWKYFKISSEVQSNELSIESNRQLVLYTRRGDIPSQTFYNWYLEIEPNQEY